MSNGHLVATSPFLHTSLYFPTTSCSIDLLPTYLFSAQTQIKLQTGHGQWSWWRDPTTHPARVKYLLIRCVSEGGN